MGWIVPVILVAAAAIACAALGPAAIRGWRFRRWREGAVRDDPFAPLPDVALLPLGRAIGPEGIPLFRRAALEDEEPRVRHWARVALCGLGSAEALESVLAGADAEERGMIASALGYRAFGGDAAVRAVIDRLERSSDPTLRQVAANARGVPRD